LSQKERRRLKGAAARDIANATAMSSEIRSPTDIPEWFLKSLQMLESPANVFGQGWVDLQGMGGAC
jgi:hypothetical protein